MTDEADRALMLIKFLEEKNIEPHDFLEGDYTEVVIHSNGTILDCSQVIADISGYSRDELKGMNLWVLFTPESGQVILEKMSRQSEEPYQAEFIGKDGNHLILELKGISFEISGEPMRAVLAKPI